MSRIGKKPIAIPAGTEAIISGKSLTVKGPKGTATKEFKDSIKIEKTEEGLVLTIADKTLKNNALWGTYASIVKSMVAGVNNHFEKKLIIEGVGYKVEAKSPTELVFSLGFSHVVPVKVPEGINVVVEKGLNILITGIDKEKVGFFAANIREMKKPEPYKGKGIRYSDEVVVRKQGKKST